MSSESTTDIEMSHIFYHNGHTIDSAKHSNQQQQSKWKWLCCCCCTSCCSFIFPSLKIRSATFVFIALLISIHILIMEPIQTEEDQAKWICKLRRLGSKDTNLIREFELQRLVFPIFLHADLMHVLGNSFALAYFAPTAEKALQFKKFVIFIIVTGISGNILSAIMRPCSLSVGASSSLFGFIGFIATKIFVNYYSCESHECAEERKNFFAYILVALLIEQLNDQIDSWGHLGGFIGGAMVGIVLQKDNVLV